jgi:hypothetical protein
MEGRMERDAGKLSFEDEARVLLANARCEHPMMTPDMRRWVEESLPRGDDQPFDAMMVATLAR